MFGTGVPACHQAVRVEHVDRVFRYRIHKEVNEVSIGIEAGGFGRTERHWGIRLGWRLLIRFEHRLYIKRTSMAETSHRHRHVMRSDGQRLTRYPRRSAQEWPVPFGSLR